MASDGEEVAEDYRHALDDLNSNMRFEISNLTLIARENTEHALAIAEVLQQHILKVGPNKKLPALYVLDSIVKNVGTPYTLYFGRNLFKIFMESYAVVDHNIRKKMEDMLKTWKDPVPGAMDLRPVFSHELVRPIENALMKVKGVGMPQQLGQGLGRPYSAMMPHRNTPTPPQTRGGSTGPQGHAQNGVHTGEQLYHGQYPQAVQNQHPGGDTPQPQGSYQAYPSQSQLPFTGGAQSRTSVESLSKDIQSLIVTAEAEFSQNPHDSSVQARIKGLHDLQNILQHQTLPQEQFELIRNKVNELSVTLNNQAPAQGQNPAIQVSDPTPPFPTQYYPSQTHSNSVTPQPQSQAQGFSQTPQVTLDSLLGQGALAALLARNSATPQAPAPSQPFSVPFRIPSTHPDTPILTPDASRQATQNPSALLDQLRRAGILGEGTPIGKTPAAAAAALPPSRHETSYSAIPAVPDNIASLLASAQQARLSQPIPSKAGSSGISTPSIKSPLAPDAISKLYDDLGVPCTQCGRRFRSDEEGKKQKTAHMDWHFRVHQRSTEVEKRGTYRSWYVDAQDWLASREMPDSDHLSSGKNDSESSPAGKSSSNKLKYIPIPDGSRGINTVCPICQEKFENKWHDTAQEWVWHDAVLVGNRAYHASCHDEATRDREGTPGVTRMPELGTVLGKRKAEAGMPSPQGRGLKTLA